MEPRRDLLATVVQEQAERDRDIQVEAKHVGFDGSAEANRGFEIGQAIDEAATRGLWRGAHHEVQQVLQHVGAHPKLDGVPGARGLRRRGRVFGVVLGRRWGAGGGAHHGEEKEVEGEEEGGRGKSP